MKLIWGGMVMSDETGRPELYTTGGRVSIASFLIITTWNSGQVSNGRRAVAFEYEQKVGEFDDLIFFFRRISQKILFFRNVQFTGNVLLLLLFFRQYSILDGNLIKNISKFCCYCCFGIFLNFLKTQTRGPKKKCSGKIVSRQNIIMFWPWNGGQPKCCAVVIMVSID